MKRYNRALLCGVSVAALFSVVAHPTAAHADQTVSTATTTALNGDGGNLTVTNSGSIITPSGSAVVVGSITGLNTLSNSGTITGYGAAGVGLNAGTINVLTNNQNALINSNVQTGSTASAGVAASYGSYIGSLTNSGTLSGVAGLNLNGSNINSVNNTSTGTILSSGGDAPIDSTGAVILSNASSITSFTNAGLISGANGINSNNYGTIGTLTNSGTGVIAASGSSGYGVALYPGGTIGTLTNQGVISSSGRTGGGVSNDGSIGLLNNLGGTLLATGSSGYGYNNQSSATINTLTNSGQIIASGRAGVGVNNQANALIADLNNSGTIAGASGTGGGYGIVNENGTIGTLTNSGVISGTTGIWNTFDSTIGQINNTIGGVITGTSIAINNGAGAGLGGITSITNAGTIGGASTPTALSNSGSIGNINNSGLISGSSYAINSTVSGSSTIGTITNSGTIAGNIAIANQDLTLVGATAPNTRGVLTGGTINVMNGNMILAGGAMLLGDNVTVNGGAGTVTNNGLLGVAASHTITGNFAQNGTLLSALSGTNSFGHLTVSGAVVLAGTLDLKLVGGFTPSGTFDLIDAASITGDFSMLELNDTACSLISGTDYTCGSYTIDETNTGSQFDVSFTSNTPPPPPVPEPVSLTLFGTGIAALGALRRRDGLRKAGKGNTGS